MVGFDPLWEVWFRPLWTLLFSLFLALVNEEACSLVIRHSWHVAFAWRNAPRRSECETRDQVGDLASFPK